MKTRRARVKQDRGLLGLMRILAHHPGGNLKGCAKMVFTPLLTEERTFINTKAEKVLNYVQGYLERMARFERIASRYTGEDGKNYCYEYLFEKVLPPIDNSVELRAVYKLRAEGEDPFYPLGEEPKVIWKFRVWQLQNNTVLLNMYYRDIGLNAKFTLKRIEEAFTIEHEQELNKEKGSAQEESVESDHQEVKQNKDLDFYFPWELMDGASENQIELVKLWCTTDQTQDELEKVFFIGSRAIANELNRLRNKYPEAKIPNGARERNKYRENWIIYQEMINNMN